jgi:hypothetical protein
MIEQLNRPDVYRTWLLGYQYLKLTCLVAGYRLSVDTDHSFLSGLSDLNFHPSISKAKVS